MPQPTPASRLSVDDNSTAGLVLAVVCAGSFLLPLTLATVIVALPEMARELHADAVLVSWVPLAFLVTNLSLMLPFGKLADNYGRKRVYALGIAINALASLAAMFGDDMLWILACRCVQGAGSAMCFGTGVAIITSVFPPNRRGLPLGINATAVYIGLTLAPALGGWVTDAFGWRAAFAVPVPLSVVVVLLIVLRLPGEWRREHPVPLDLAGSVLFAGWTVALTVGLWGLPDWSFALLLGLAVVLLGAFLHHQSRQEHPLLRLGMFRESRVYSLSLLANMLMYWASYPLTFLLSLYLQFIQGLSPAQAGNTLLLNAAAMALIAPFAGRWSDRVQPRLIATAGCVLFTLGLALIGHLSAQTGIAAISFALLVTGAGMGLFTSPNNNAVMNAAHPSELGVAAATANLARVNGNLLGMSVVNLLVHLKLGDAPITPERYPALLETINIALALALVFAVLACAASAARGAVSQPGNG